MVTLRFKNYDQEGKAVQFEWSFEPLRYTKDRPDLFYLRDEGKDASGHLLRQAYAEQEVIKLKIAAAILVIGENFQLCKGLFRSIDARIEIKGDGEKGFTSYTADLEGLVEFERVEDIDPWVTYELTLYEEEPRDLTQWLR